MNKLLNALVSVILLFTFISLSDKCFAQDQIKWIGFEQLDDALREKPKKVFVDFYTSWCIYCRKMDKRVFTKPEVIQKLNSEYYAVKMDAETRDIINFDGKEFSNELATKKRKGFHKIAMLLGSRDGQFAPPTMLVLNENFEIEGRYFEYLTAEELLKIL
ncbi:MAG: thioredoxin fold domain-containing protein [Bacteroidota bacterium]